RLWDLVSGAVFTAANLAFVGRLEESAELLREMDSLAERLGHTAGGLGFFIDVIRAGDIDAQEHFGRSALERGRRGEHDASIWTGLTFLAVAHFWRGRWQEALSVFDEA